MSTKVYTGFKFIPATLDGVTKALAKVASDIEEMQRHRYRKVYASMLVSLMDRNSTARLSSRNAKLETPRWRVSQQIADRQRRIRATQERDPAVDWEISLQCWQSKAAGRIIGAVDGEMSDQILTFLVDRKIVERFGYWNNTDPEEGVPRREWNARKKAWDQALDNKSGMPFTFDFEGRYIAFERSPTWAELEPYVPTLDERANRAADNFVSSRFFKTLPDFEKNVFGAIGQFARMKREDDATKRALAAAKRRYMKRLMTNEQLSAAKDVEQLLLVDRER